MRLCLHLSNGRAAREVSWPVSGGALGSRADTEPSRAGATDMRHVVIGMLQTDEKSTDRCEALVCRQLTLLI